MSPVYRFICHLLIVWLALLSGGAHAASDAAHGIIHAAAQASPADDGRTPRLEAKKIDTAHGGENSETCALSHCGHSHATGMIPAMHLRFSDASPSAPLPTLQAWASREQPDAIERPKWRFTTPAVVNL